MYKYPAQWKLWQRRILSKRTLAATGKPWYKVEYVMRGPTKDVPLRREHGYDGPEWQDGDLVHPTLVQRFDEECRHKKRIRLAGNALDKAIDREFYGVGITTPRSWEGLADLAEAAHRFKRMRFAAKMQARHQKQRDIRRVAATRKQAKKQVKALEAATDAENGPTKKRKLTAEESVDVQAEVAVDAAEVAEDGPVDVQAEAAVVAAEVAADTPQVDWGKLHTDIFESAMQFAKTAALTMVPWRVTYDDRRARERAAAKLAKEQHFASLTKEAQDAELEAKKAARSANAKKGWANKTPEERKVVMTSVRKVYTPEQRRLMRVQWHQTSNAKRAAAKAAQPAEVVVAEQAVAEERAANMATMQARQQKLQDMRRATAETRQIKQADKEVNALEAAMDTEDGPVKNRQLTANEIVWQNLAKDKALKVEKSTPLIQRANKQVLDHFDYVKKYIEKHGARPTSNAVLMRWGRPVHVAEAAEGPSGQDWQTHARIAQHRQGTDRAAPRTQPGPGGSWAGIAPAADDATDALAAQYENEQLDFFAIELTAEEQQDWDVMMYGSRVPTPPRASVDWQDDDDEARLALEAVAAFEGLDEMQTPREDLEDDEAGTFWTGGRR